MDSEDEYEKETATRVFLEHGYAVGGREEEIKPRSHSSSSSEYGRDHDGPPVLTPHHTMDMHIVRRPPGPVIVPADRVSTHDLPLAAPLAVVERELFHNGTRSVGLNTCAEEGEEGKRVPKKRRKELTFE